jgi:hypothetical protein
MKRNTLLCLICYVILILFASCDDLGGDGEAFNSVTVFATFEDEPYDADAVKWEDAEEPKDGVCDTDFYEEDEISLTITSDSIVGQSSDVVPSDVIVISYTVEFTAREDESPDVPSKTFRHRLVIPPDSEGTIPIRLIDQGDKSVNSLHPLNAFDYYFVNGGLQYKYTVTVRVKLQELLSGRTQTIKAQLPLYYFDIADECVLPATLPFN